MYQSGTMLLSILWTAAGSQDFLAFGYLDLMLAIAWLCPQINTLQDILICYYV